MHFNKNCQLWGLNPRPFGLAPKASAFDHSAKLTFLSISAYFRLYILEAVRKQQAQYAYRVRGGE